MVFQSSFKKVSAPGFYNLPGVEKQSLDGTRNTEFDTRSNLCPNPGTPTSDVGARRARRPAVMGQRQ